MLFDQHKKNPSAHSNLSFRDQHLWPEDIQQLGLMLFHRTFDKKPSVSKNISPLFYTFTEQLVECHHLRELEQNFDRRLLLSRMVSDPDTDTASLVTKIPFHKDGTILQMLHLVFIEQRDNNWFLCVEEPDWKHIQLPPPPNWKPTIEGFNTRSSKNKDPKPMGLGNWFSKSRFFDLSPLPTASEYMEFQ